MLVLPELPLNYLPLKVQQDIEEGLSKEAAIFQTISSKFSYCNEEEISNWKDRIKAEIGKDQKLVELFKEMNGNFFTADEEILEKALQLFSSEYDSKMKVSSFDERILLKGDFLYESPFKSRSGRKQGGSLKITPKKSFRRLSFEGMEESSSIIKIKEMAQDQSSFTYFSKIFKSKDDVEKMLSESDKMKVMSRIPEDYQEIFGVNFNEFHCLVEEKCLIFNLTRITDKINQISQFNWLVFERMSNKVKDFWLNLDFIKSTVSFSYEVFMNLYEVSEISIFEIVDIIKLDPFYLGLYIEDFLSCLPEVSF